MRIINTDKINYNTLTSFEKLAVYNAFDVLITREVFDKIHPMLDDTTRVTYNFMKALQAPILEMELHGYLIDRGERQRKIAECIKKLERLEEILNTYTQATMHKDLNARSWQQKGYYFYNFAQCKEVRVFNYQLGRSQRTTNRAAMETLAEKYPKIRPAALCVLAIMDISKQLGTLKSRVDKDGYMRASYMIAGTVTGRLSSKKNIFNTGTNLQNIAEHLRTIFTVQEGPIPEREKYNIPKEFL